MRKKYALLGLALMLGSLSLKAQNPSKFIDRANMNLSVKPGDDFVTYSNGNWSKTTQFLQKKRAGEVLTNCAISISMQLKQS